MNPVAREFPVADEYRSLVHTLAANRAQRITDTRTLERSYLDGCAAAAQAVSHAAARVSDAAAAARTAATLVTDADADAATLWRELGRVLGRHWSARLGPLPAPAAEADDTDPAVPLSRAAEEIAAADEALPRRVPAAALPLLALLGAAGAVVVALPAKGLLAAFGGSLVVTILAQLMIFVAPFAALPLARNWVRSRWRAKMEFGAFALTAISGMVACCAIVAWLG